MTSLVLIDDESQAKVWRAVGISIAIHLLVVAIYPTLSHIPLPALPDKLEIEFFTMKMPAAKPSEQQVTPPVVTSAPPEPQTTPTTVKPRTAPPVENQKSVITAPAQNEADYQVPEQALPARVEPAPAVNTTAAPSSSDAANHTATESAAKETRAAPAVSAPVSNESEELAASDNDAWGDYGDQLRNLVNKSKQYPTIAIRRHLEGDATIQAQFVRGELVQVSLVDSSKHAPLDEEAVRMVKKAIAQLGVKESLRKKTFKITIPVSFRLE
ncbi:TonB family protein [Methylophilus luteus]|uniref:TonB family protein n=1 Tax=Methylophilus luteus TaxID=640108 RepID=A0ABW3F6X6_9PROT